MKMRVGQGVDVHAFTEGDHVVLGGVQIPFSKALAAHSDGDVALHALCDAMLGAAALGDIGRHFPPSDERWKGADSRIGSNYGWNSQSRRFRDFLQFVGPFSSHFSTGICP